MRLTKALLNFALKGHRPFAGLVLTTTLVGEMTLALDVRVLQAIGPGTDLPRAELSEADQIGDFRFEISTVRLSGD
jgi:hypothetical protein